MIKLQAKRIRTVPGGRMVNESPIFYGWIIMAVATFGMIMTSPGQTYAVSIFIDYFITDLGLSRSSVSTLYTVGTLAGSVGVLFSANRGKSFQHLHVFPRDTKLPHRGPNVERPTGHHRVDVPWLLFCTGEKGPDCYGKGLFNVTRAVQLTFDPEPAKSKR